MKPRLFALPPEIGLDAVIDALAPLGEVVAEPAQTVDRLFMDSFDWRAFAAGGVVEFDRRAKRLGWRKLGGRGEPREAAPAAQPPRFPAELPEGALRQRLEGLLEMRALLPLARWRGRVTPLRLERPGGETLLRLQLEEGRLAAPGGRRGVRPAPRLHLLPRRGREKEAKRAVKRLEKLGLTPAAPLYPDELAGLGLTPGDYSTKPRLTAPPGERSDRAVKELLRALLRVMERNEQGMIDGIDSEFLHDYRVALRRSRSALAQMKGLFPARDTERFKRGLAWLGEVTSPLRDLDVQRLKLPAYRAALPAKLRDALDPLEALLERRQRESRRRLQRQFATVRYRRLIDGWRAFLDAPPAERSPLPHARQPIVERAAARIRKLRHRAVTEGAALGPKSPDADYHELRKTCKKLRYLMEFFLPLYPKQEVTPLIAATKALHSTLGELQDIHVQLAEFQSYRDELAERDELPEATAKALDALARQLNKQRKEELKAFRHRFAAFAAPEAKAQFKAIYGKRAVAEATP